jgi:phage tail-like protein
MGNSRRIWTFSIVPLAALALIAPARSDLARSPSVRLELDGSSLGSFSKIEGLSVSVEILEFRDGGDPNAIPRKLPGRTTFANITLKRGFVNQSFFESWIGQVREGDQGFRKNLAIVILGRNGAEVARYNLFECWPASWELSSEDDEKGNDIVMEKVVIAVERFAKA